MYSEYVNFVLRFVLCFLIKRPLWTGCFGSWDAIGHFWYIKIQHDNESQRTQTKKMNKRTKKMNKQVYSFSLFVSSKTRYHAEF